ncbi:hypothetical protein GLIP_4023 [Aliiglaciecola lipolytica E3]|uniref:Uncharacterized protein n=1 Tax=Aliiglaciecola lipolytica E3 TaxID=1127673 RepID=K6X7M9_9ALTE|nr:hypothetical protein GLIP_4023 [Aliiglaciecola lipolytica E3]
MYPNSFFALFCFLVPKQPLNAGFDGDSFDCILMLPEGE